MHELPIDQKKLHALVRQCKHFNVFPIFLPRYFHSGERPPSSAKPHPITELLVDLIDECVGYLSAMTQQEIESLMDSLPPGLRMFIEPESSLEQVPPDRIALYYLAAELQRKYAPFDQIVESNLGRSEVLRIYPELRDKLDRDGLLHIDNDLRLLDGGIEYRDHILHYHQFLRRGYTSNPNFDFFYRFIACYNRTRSTNQFRVAIDHRRIMPREFYQQIIELDTWYGPPFDPERLDDPKAVGLTIVKRNNDSLFGLTNSLDRTEFFWSLRRGIKTFEVEEVSALGYQFDQYYLNRYVHSERDTQKRVLRHLDGAVKVYLPDNYSDRFNSNIPTEAKSHVKIKLFRVDGNIVVDDWIELISFFFKSNEMIIEYFNPEQFKTMFEERVRDYKTWKQKQQGETV